MAEKNKKSEFLYQKVFSINNDRGELKNQVTVEVSEWDTSKMEGYVAGSPVHTGLNFTIKTLKPDKKYPRQRIDIDAENQDFRDALREAFAVVDEFNN